MKRHYIALLISAIMITTPAVNAKPVVIDCVAQGVGEMPNCAHLQIGQVMALIQPVQDSSPVTTLFQRVAVTLETPDGWASIAPGSAK